MRCRNNPRARFRIRKLTQNTRLKFQTKRPWHVVVKLEMKDYKSAEGGCVCSCQTSPQFGVLHHFRDTCRYSGHSINWESLKRQFQSLVCRAADALAKAWFVHSFHLSEISDANSAIRLFGCEAKREIGRAIEVSSNSFRQVSRFWSDCKILRTSSSELWFSSFDWPVFSDNVSLYSSLNKHVRRVKCLLPLFEDFHFFWIWLQQDPLD